MAYQRQKWEFRLGGVNLAAPGDQIAEGDALEVSNFRADRIAHLRSRRGHSAAELSGISPAGPIHTAVRLANNRYWGVGGQLWRGVASIATGLSTTVLPFGLALLGRHVWIMNRGAQLRDDGTTVSTWSLAAPVAAPTLAATGSGSITGTYYYYVTFGTAPSAGNEDFESNPSPTSAAVDCTAGVASVDLSAIPTGPAGTQCRHIYRVGGDLEEATWVTAIYDNTTTTYSDTRLDADIAADALARVLETDHDPAPAADGCIAYLNRMVAWGGAAHPRRVYYTPAFKNWYFPGSTNGAAGNWFDAKDDVLNCTAKGNTLCIYTRTGIERVPGDIDENAAEPVRGDFGLASARGLVSAGPVDYLYTREGLARFNGDSGELISPKLEPIMHDDYYFVARGDTLLHAPFSRISADLETLSMALRSGRIWVSALDEAGVRQTWIYKIDSQKWVKDRRQIYNYLNDRERGELIGCFWKNRAGSAYYGAHSLDDATNDVGPAGAGMDLAWHSSYDDQSFPENEKVYDDLTLDLDTAGQNMSVFAYTNNGELAGDKIAVGSVNTATRQPVTLRLNTASGPGIRGRNLAVRLECAHTATDPVLIHNVFAHYYVEPRKARNFDTGEIDLGSPWVKQLDQVLLNLVATQPVTWKLYSELPSGTMAQRATGTIAATARTAVPLPISDVVEGRLVRLTLTCPDGVFQLFDSVKFLVRMYPEVYDGSKGQKYITQDSLLAA